MRWTWHGRVAVVGLALALTLAPPSQTLAGGVAVILDALPATLEAGTLFSVGFTIRSAHADRTPQPGLSPVVIATAAATDQSLTVRAAAEGAPGHYVAELTLPAAGTWQWRIHPFGAHERDGATTLPPLIVGGSPAVEDAVAAVETVDVKAHSNAFMPAELRVRTGTTVVWHMGDLPHTVTAHDGRFASGGIEPGATYSYTFAQPGTFSYLCEYHPGMQGVVVVAGRLAGEAEPAKTSQPVAAAPAQLLPATGRTDAFSTGGWGAALGVGLLLIALGLVRRWPGRR